MVARDKNLIKKEKYSKYKQIRVSITRQISRNPTFVPRPILNITNSASGEYSNENISSGKQLDKIQGNCSGDYSGNTTFLCKL